MKILNTLVIGLMLCFSAQAQTLQPGLLSASGGSGASPSGSLSWSVGELAVSTFSSEGQQLTQGFYQNDMALTPVFEVGRHSISMEVFPNPSTQQIFIERRGKELPEQRFILFNFLGQSQLSGNLTGEVTSIDLNTLPAQTYFLQIFGHAGRQLAVFKIQKIN